MTRLIQWVRSVDAIHWLALLLIIFLVPLIVNALVPRHTAFRIITETQGFSGTLTPNNISHTLSIVAKDATLCSDAIISSAESLSVTNDNDFCLGFSASLDVPAGTLTFLETAHVQVVHIGNQRIELTISPLEPVTEAPCSKPVVRIEFNTPIVTNSDDIQAMIMSDDDANEALACGVTRFSFQGNPGATNNWIVLNGLDIAFGSDIGPFAQPKTPATLSGNIEIYGFDFFTDLMRTLRSALTPQRGYILLKGFNVNFADVVRFANDDETQTSFYISSLITEQGFVASAWIVASESVISTYGSPGYVLRPTAIERLLNDPLLNYWGALALTLLSLWLRAVILGNQIRALLR